MFVLVKHTLVYLICQHPQTHQINRILPPSEKIPPKYESHYGLKVACHRQARLTKQLNKLNEDNSFNTTITMTKDEQTTMVKNIQKDVQRIAISAAHAATTKVSPSFLQCRRNAGYAMGATFWRGICHLKRDNQRVKFQNKEIVATFWDNDEIVMIMYNSGADGNYNSKPDREKAGLPILWQLTKRVAVADVSTRSGKFIT